MNDKEYIEHATSEWMKLFKTKSNLSKSDLDSLEECIRYVIESTLQWAERNSTKRSMRLTIVDKGTVKI